MRRFRKPLLIGLGLLGGLASLAIGGWFYAVSNVEQPKYAIVAQDGDFEIRDYPALVMAEVSRSGDRNLAVRSGFGPLAGYIFAKNREGPNISMTAPVLQERQAAADAAARTWLIRFVMPAQYTLETLPKAAGEEVRLIDAPSSRRAAVRFSGVATDGLIADNEAALRTWLAGRGIAVVGEPTYAYYNDPFTPGPFRRNEVLFEVQRP